MGSAEKGPVRRRETEGGANQTKMLVVHLSLTVLDNAAISSVEIDGGKTLKQLAISPCFREIGRNWSLQAHPIQTEAIVVLVRHGFQFCMRLF
jgi:hypothetical protein